MTVKLYNADCTEALREIPSASVDCVITDPPYPEISRDYGRMSEADWHAMMDVVVPECRRILKPSGSAVFILQPNSERVGRMRPWLWEFMAKWTREWGMVQDAWWWNICAIPEAHSIQGRLMRPSLKACVWLGDADCFRNQDAVLWTESEVTVSRKLSERSRGNGGRRNHSPSGHGMHTLTKFDAAERRGGVTPYNVNPIRNVSMRASQVGGSHGAMTPEPLADWWLRYICPPGGTVCDPFIGSGTVGIAAVKRGCSVIGIERMEKYHAIASARIAQAQAARAEQLIPA